VYAVVCVVPQRPTPTYCMTLPPPNDGVAVDVTASRARARHRELDDVALKTGIRRRDRRVGRNAVSHGARNSAASRSPIADEDCVMTNAPPVIAVPAIEVVTVASAVERTLPSMVPTSLTVPLNGARTTPATPVRQLNAVVPTTTSSEDEQ
jgi:hypothetical protein